MTTPAPAPAPAQISLGPLVQMTKGDPLKITVDLPGDGSCFLESQVEDQLAVNPTRPNNIVAGVQQDRWGSGAARALAAAVSFDGGSTFTTVPVPLTTVSTGGTFQRAADPWVAFSTKGRAFFSGLLGDFNTRTSAVTVSISDDGGLTWAPPINLSQDAGNDKETITTDRLDPNFVYVVWHKNPPGADEDGSVFFSRSTSGGASWEKERDLVDFPTHSGSIGNQIVHMPPDRLVNLFARQDFTETTRLATLYTMHSDDKGVTWTAPISGPALLSRATLTADGVGVRDPETGTNVRAGGYLPFPAQNLQTGDLYNVWQDTRFAAPGGISPLQADPNSLIDEIAFSVSHDQGATWSAPIKINQTPTQLPLLHRQAFLPTIAVAPDGTVVVTYYDFRNDLPGTGLGTDAWAVFHRPNAGPITDPSSWGEEVRLSNATFNLRLAPLSMTTIGEPDPGTDGYFLGDYVGIVATPGGGVETLFSQPLNGAPATGVVRHIATAGLR